MVCISTTSICRIAQCSDLSFESLICSFLIRRISWTFWYYFVDFICSLNIFNCSQLAICMDPILWRRFTKATVRTTNRYLSWPKSVANTVEHTTSSSKRNRKVKNKKSIICLSLKSPGFSLSLIWLNSRLNFNSAFSQKEIYRSMYDILF